MRTGLPQMFRKLALVALVALGILAMVVCGVSPASRRVESGAGACPEESWTEPESVEPVLPRPRASAPHAEARAQEPVDPTTLRGRVIEDATGHALDAFYAALATVERRHEQGDVARITCYGDSHTAADFMTGRLRRRMQRRFGDAGHGFIVAGRPWPSYRHRDARNGSRGRWETHRVRHNARSNEIDGRLGLAGVALETDRPDGQVWVGTSTDAGIGRNVSRFELYFLGQPRGGELRLLLDGDEAARISTRREGFMSAYHLIETNDGPHELRIESLGHGMVRLFGVVMEREGPGVVVDSLGINGARITATLAWDRETFWDNLAHRGPDLVLMWYGANSVGDDWYDLETYEQWVIDALTQMRRAVPEASCLLVGPPDMSRASFAYHGPPGTPPQLAPLIEAQRDAANLVGCGYFDIFEAMGGEDAILEWIDHEPTLVSGDGIHFTAPGYERLGDLIYAAIIDGYEQYLEAHPEG